MGRREELRIHIRIALHSLGRDVDQKLPSKADDRLAMLKSLRAEQREVGGILK